MHTFLQKDSLNNRNTIPQVPADKISNVNCHKFVLYVLGRISWNEMVSDTQIQEKADPSFDFTFGKQARSISDKEFISIKDADSLYELANRDCELGKAYVGQILDSETGDLAHSFMVERMPNGTYMCSDKQGFKHYPFSVHELGTLLDFVNKKGEISYQNQKWRFIPMTEAVRDVAMCYP